MTKTDENEWLRKRLDMVIQLLLEMTPGGAASTTRKIERLLALGFSQSEVAQVVGKKVNYVSAVVAGAKKATNARQTKKMRGRQSERLALPAPRETPGDEQWSDAGNSEITRRLDTLIRLVATALCAERPQKDKISILAGAGLAPKEIAEIVGTTPNTVSVSLSAMRRMAKPKPKSKLRKKGAAVVGTAPDEAPPPVDQ